jgi:hypothetical protein
VLDFNAEEESTSSEALSLTEAALTFCAAVSVVLVVVFFVEEVLVLVEESELFA